MRKLVNAAAMSFQGSLPDRRYYDVLVAKRSYLPGQDGQLHPAREQELLSVADTFRGDPAASSLVSTSNIVPYKPVADVVLVADAHSPGGRPSRRWICGVEIVGPNPMSCFFQVSGPRQWQPDWHGKPPADFSGRTLGFAGWRLSDPEPVRQVELIWENAWGGQHPAGDKDQPIVLDERNPVGTGWIHPDRSDHRNAVTAPQIEWPNQPVADPYAVCPAVAPGPIPPSWLPRRPLGGSFGEAWLRDQSPYWPLDYDPAYHNAAPPWMRIPGFLQGGELIRLHALIPGQPLLDLRLPGTALLATINGQDYRLAADTLELDLRPKDPENWLIAVTWRLVLPPGMAGSVTLDEVLIGHERHAQARAPFSPPEVASWPEVVDDR